MSKKRPPPKPFPCPVGQCSEHGWRRHDPKDDFELDRRVFSSKAIEVLQEFASHGQTQPETDETTTVGIEWIKLPPWRDRLKDSDQLGPEHGPKLSMYATEVRKHAELYTAGGLWDPKEAEPTECISLVTGEVLKPKPREPEPRYDEAEVSKFVEHHSARIPKRELEVYFLYWRSRKSIGTIGRELGLRAASVRKYIYMVRMRSRGLLQG